MNGTDKIEGRYVFGHFQLDPNRRRLTRDDVALTLTPTVLEVLIHLVANAGKVVTKDDLLNSVWPARIVEESNVKQAIFTLRRALGSDGDTMIVTVPGRGYRFVEQVLWSGLPLAAAPVTDGAPAATPARRPRRAMILIAMGCLALASAGAAWLWHHAMPGVQSRTVVLADFENRTGDPVFDRALASLLRVDLTQSPFLNVLSDAQDQRTLALMMRPRDTALVPAVADEICARNNADAVLHSGIASLETHYLLVLTVTDCSGIKEIAAEKEEVLGKAAVVPALDRLITRVRAKLGESKDSIEKFDVPLMSEQTASLDALKAFSEAQFLANHGHLTEAIPLDRHAIDLDPHFSAAYASLGVIFATRYDQKQSAENLTKAYALRDSVNERARLGSTALYHQFVTADFGEAIRNFQVWTEIYPRDVIGWNNLANAEDYIGLHAQAVRDGTRALALKPYLSNPYAVVARADLAAGHADEALAVAKQAVDQGMAGDSIHRELLRIAIARQDSQAIQREKAWADGTPTAQSTQEVEAEISFSHGQVATASAIFDRITNATKGTYTFTHMRALQAQMLDETGLMRQAADVLPGPGDEMTPDPDYLLALARVGDVRRIQTLEKKLLRLSPHDTLLRNFFAPETEAILALRRGDAQGAIGALRPAATFASRSLDVPYLLGQAYLAAGDGKQAAAAFNTILSNRGWSPESVLYPLAKLGLARALFMEHKTSDSATAYRAFFVDWQAADPAVPILQTAKGEYAQIMRQTHR